VRSVLSRFGPVVMGRGVVQIMGYVDLWLASFLAAGAVSSLTYAQVLYLLPISVFGMSVAAAELPELSRVDVDDPETRQRFRARLQDGLARILFYVAPTTTLFIVVGDVVVRALFQRDPSGIDTALAIWFVIAAFSLGLPATTASRLLQNALYALDDARTPARVAGLRVVASGVIGLAIMFPLDRLTVARRRGLGLDRVPHAVVGRCLAHRSHPPGRPVARSHRRGVHRDGVGRLRCRPARR
jgi:putative peptidoglycan lipid II flippase